VQTLVDRMEREYQAALAGLRNDVRPPQAL
jgi:hypothetical protein